MTKARFRVRGFESLQIGDDSYKAGDIVELDVEQGRHFNLEPVTEDAELSAPQPRKTTATVPQSPTKASNKVGATHTAPPVDREAETPGQTVQGPESGETGAKRRR